MSTKKLVRHNTNWIRFELYVDGIWLGFEIVPLELWFNYSGITILLYLQEEKIKCQMEYMESIKKLEEKWSLNQQKHTNNVRTDGTYITEVIWFLLLCFFLLFIIIIINFIFVVLLMMAIINVVEVSRLYFTKSRFLEKEIL